MDSTMMVAASQWCEAVEVTAADLSRVPSLAAETRDLLAVAKTRDVSATLPLLSPILEWAAQTAEVAPSSRARQLHTELRQMVDSGCRLRDATARQATAGWRYVSKCLRSLDRACQAAEAVQPSREARVRVRDISGFAAASVASVADSAEIRAGLTGTQTGIPVVDLAIAEVVKAATPRSRWSTGRLYPVDGVEDISFGVILKPGNVEKREGADLQGDIATPDEIDACLEDLQGQIAKGKVGMGVEHTGQIRKELSILTAGKLPTDLRVAGEDIPAGSLIVKFRHAGDTGQKIRDGKLTGLSLEADADRTPLATAFAFTRHGLYPNPIGAVITAPNSRRRLIVVGQRRVNAETLLETARPSGRPGPWVYAHEARILKADPIGDVDPASWTELVGIVNVNRQNLNDIAAGMTQSGAIEASDVGKAITGLLEAYDRMEKAYNVQEAQQQAAAAEEPADTTEDLAPLPMPGDEGQPAEAEDPFRYGEGA